MATSIDVFNRPPGAAFGAEVRHLVADGVNLWTLKIRTQDTTIVLFADKPSQFDNIRTAIATLPYYVAIRVAEAEMEE